MNKFIALFGMLLAFVGPFASLSEALAEETSPEVALVAAVAKQYKIPENQAAEQVQRIFSTIRSELKGGRSVAVENFGRFSVSERRLPAKAVKADAPQTAQSAKSATRKYAKFAPAEVLKVDLNQPSVQTKG